MKKTQNQSGFAHLMVVIAILGIAVIGLLGFVFWQNFMQPKTSVKNNTTPSSSTNSTPTTADPKQIALTEVAYDQSKNSGLAFKYPKGWTLVHKNAIAGTDNSVAQADSNVVTSPDGAISITLDVGVEGIGGACDSSNTSYRLTGFEYQQLSALPQYSLNIFTAHSSETGYIFDQYMAQITDYSQNFQTIKVGDSPCKVYSLAFDSPNGFTTWFNMKLNNIENSTANVMDKINAAMSTDNFAIAKRIMLSLYKQ